jgi:hypothetical protein
VAHGLKNGIIKLNWARNHQGGMGRLARHFDGFTPELRITRVRFRQRRSFHSLSQGVLTDLLLVSFGSAMKKLLW